MKYKYLYLILFISSFSSVAQNKILFEIGKKDGKSVEFALAPSDYKTYLSEFSGEKEYVVGYSTPDKHWSYVLPGPLDSWAGGGYWAGFHPRHFPIIYFNLDKTTNKGDCMLSLFFTGANATHPIKIRVEINGHRFEEDLNGEDNDNLLLGKTTIGKPKEIRLSMPSDWLKKGINKIQIGTIAGTWAIVDCIRMEAPKATMLKLNTSTSIHSVEAASFEYALDNGAHIQPVLVDLTQIDEARTLTFQVAGFPSETKRIEAGKGIIEIAMPALANGKKDKTVSFTIKDGSKLVYKKNIIRAVKPLHTYADYVDLLMGTGNSRWMFKPGPSLPLSMVQIAPDNQNQTWKAGYEYTIENIMGFNHFSDWTMTGFLMQPTCGPLKINPGDEKNPDEGYRSRIDKSSEKAKIGHYSVFMTDTKIKAELTSTRRAALQRYTFSKHDDARILIDMFTPNEYEHTLQHAKITKINDTHIEGTATYYNANTGYSLEQNYTVHFILQFSKPFDSVGGWERDAIKQNISSIEGKDDVGIFVNYKTKDSEEILVRSAVSLVDMQGARNNLEQELSKPFGWDFEKVVDNARTIWNDYLGRIAIETDDYLQKKKFYTNMYRSLSARAIWSDADGRFVDECEKICKLEKADQCIISGEYWNTFWTNQQVLNLIAPEISSLWANSAIQLYKNSGWFNTDPAGIEHTGVMVAMHVISQIQGAWQSEIRDFDLETAFTGLKKMLTVSPQPFEGGGTVGVENLIPYIKYGYIPSGHGTVSNTLEYAYDDWCLGQMAKVLGKEADYNHFNKRADSWENLFDVETGFIRPKDDKGNWINPFDPYHTPGFTEGNAFNYTWFVPHNPEKLVNLMGRERFIERLDKAMIKSARANFNAAGDNFSEFPVNQGNQTSMEVAYLFNFAKAPWLTQKWSRAIQEQYYGTTPYDAYPGDEDLGQMSSWFVMSAIGFFQMDGGCGAIPQYELASPRYPKITLNLGEKYNRARMFVIEAENASKENMYIQSATLNGVPVKGFRINQADVLKGGNLKIIMGNTPNKEWGID